MSEHKTGNSNLTDEQRKLYRERRAKGVPGLPGHVNMHVRVKDDKGVEQTMPLGYKRGPGTRSHGVRPSGGSGYDRRFTKKGFKGHKTTEKHPAPAGEGMELSNHERNVMRQQVRSMKKAGRL